MAAASSSSSTSSFKYDVFLSFRGEDIRKTFVDHLYYALKRQGIHTYKDDEEIEQGKRIDSELIRSIEESRLYIVVFSKKYASSSWCLDELVKIMECHKTANHIAYPVFYDVEPSEVRNQKGAVGEAFAEHKNEQDAGKWAKALKEAADLAGWDLKTIENGHEAKFINTVVGKISLKLHSTKLHTDEKLIGMEPRIKLVLSSLEATISDVRMIGIKGIGGGGKTTLARAIFDEVSIRFEGRSFVENVREVSKAPLLGLKSLQKQVLSDVFRDPDIILNSVGDGKHMIKDRLCGMNVIIVLDDVDHIDQLEALAGARNWFKQGSIIIITTRDENVLLTHGVDEIHDVNLLENDEAMRLFNRYAFPKGIPSQGYEKLSKKVLRYAAGLPLTIRVLGATLCGKVKHEWRDALKRLEKIPLKETLEILELSYIGLSNDYKEIFLDVACFLKLSHKDDAIRILECCGFNAHFGLKELEQKSLITITNDQCLGMHDQIQQMGWNIVRRVQLDDPRQHSRLWIRKEIETILDNDSGTIATSAITVEDFLVKLNSIIVTKGFGKLKKLRLLRVVSEIEDEYGCWDEMADQVEQNFPHTLRYLRWEFYPHRYLPRKFVANDLVALEMSHCKILRLWEGGEMKVLNKLRFLDLKHSKLISLHLDLTPNLEKLDLEGCDHLVQLQTPIGCPKRLVYLNLSGCLKVDSFSFIKSLGSLKVLCLNYLSLKEFPDIIPEHCNSRLLELQFKFNPYIEELPSSIANFQKLVSLDLHSCRNLKSIPKKLCGLQQLKSLELYGCILEELPDDFPHLQCLQKLNLSFARIRCLPKGICKMKHLETLNLSSCVYLEKLPSDLGRLECLEELILTECEQVTDIPDSICKLERLKYFSLLDCVRVDKLPQELGQLKNLEVLNVKGTRIRHFPSSLNLLKGLKIHENKSVLQSRGYACTSGTIKTSYKKRKIGDMDQPTQTEDPAQLEHEEVTRPKRMTRRPSKYDD